MLRRALLALVAAALLTVATGCSQERLFDSAVRLEQKIAGLEQKSLHVADHNIYYVEGGTGPTIVLLHGFAADSGNWTRFAGRLTGRYHVVIPDLPGFGNSSQNPSANYSIQAQTERVRDLMRALGIKQFHLVGNSMGGYIGAYYAAVHPEDILTLGLFNAAGVTSPTPSFFVQQMEAGNNILLPKDPADYDRILKLAMADPPYIPDCARDVLGKRAFSHSEFNRKIFTDLQQAKLDLVPYLPKIKAPTLLLWGDLDQIIDKSSISVFQTHLTGTKTTVELLPGLGHAPMIEQPVEAAQRYLGFLGT